MPGGPPCGDEDWFARLDSAVYSSDWMAYGTLHIGDCEVVPAATYAIHHCDPMDPSICSGGGGSSGDEVCPEVLPVAPLLIPTQPAPFNAPGARASYGDVAGPISPSLQFNPPDGFVSVIDISAYLLTQQNWGTANLPQAHPTWIDLHGLGYGSPPQYILNVSDLSQIMFGYNGNPWTQDTSNLQPGECP